MRKSLKVVATAIAGLFVLTWSAPGASAQSADEVYELVQVDGNALPATVADDDEGCVQEVMSATLTLAADNTWRIETHMREVCGNDAEEDRDTETGRFTVDGNTITFADDDGTPEDSDENDRAAAPDLEDLLTATRTQDGLVVTLDDGRTKLTFRRR